MGKETGVFSSELSVLLPGRGPCHSLDVAFVASHGPPDTPLTKLSFAFVVGVNGTILRVIRSRDKISRAPLNVGARSRPEPGRLSDAAPGPHTGNSIVHGARPTGCTWPRPFSPRYFTSSRPLVEPLEETIPSPLTSSFTGKQRDMEKGRPSHSP